MLETLLRRIESTFIEARQVRLRAGSTAASVLPDSDESNSMYRSWRFQKASALLAIFTLSFPCLPPPTTGICTPMIRIVSIYTVKTHHQF